MTIWKLLQSAPVGFSVTVPLTQQKSAFSISVYRVLSNKRTMLWGIISELWVTAPSFPSLWGRSVVAVGGERHCDDTERQTPGKVKQAFVYVQVLANLSECSENQSVISNISPASPSCVPQAGCEGCSVWNAHAGGSGAKAGVTAPALLCKHNLCRSGPAYLSLWLRVRHSCSGCRSVPPSCSLRVTQLRPLALAGWISLKCISCVYTPTPRWVYLWH